MDYVALDVVKDARAEMDRAHKLGGSSRLRGDQSDHVFLSGQPDGVQKTLALVAGRPDEFLVIQALAGTQQFSGRYPQAAATAQQVFEQAGTQKRPTCRRADLDLCGGQRFGGLVRGKRQLVEQAHAGQE